MKRKIIDELAKWKKAKERKPLMIEGARQVGKTYLIEKEFAPKFFDNFVKVNLQNPEPEIVALFEGNIDPRRIINTLEILYNTKITPGRTLIFFDEVQEVPRALTSLKYFCEDTPEYHVVVAGSLLGVYLNRGSGSDSSAARASFPVGKVDTMRLEPMSFEEFLWAKEQSGMVNVVSEDPSITTFDERLLDSFREYLVVGGMPEAVQSWINHHDVVATSAIQRAILSNYEHDFIKYTDETLASRIRQVFERLPHQFAKANEKFIYGVVKDGARAREYELAVEWLANAGIVRRVSRVSRGDKLPLKAYAENENFKLYFLDVGLFRSLAEIEPRLIFEKDAIFNEFGGLLAEQFVLQQLAPRAAYYWSGSSTAEVDFVIQDKGRIIPIEVKSGTNVHAKSLKIYRENYQPALSLRFSLLGFAEDDGLTNFPLFKMFGLEKYLRERYLHPIVQSNLA